MQRTRTDTPPTFLRNYGPLKFCCENRVRFITSIYCPEYFHETLWKYKPPSDNVQRKRTISLPALVTELCPFEIFAMKIMSAL